MAAAAAPSRYFYAFVIITGAGSRVPKPAGTVRHAARAKIVGSFTDPGRDAPQAEFFEPRRRLPRVYSR
jgi:hypothetical protein